MAPSPATAQTWDGSTSDDWTDGTNWSGNAVPAGGHVNILTSAPNTTILGVGGAVAGVTNQLYVARWNGTTGNLTVQNGSTLTTNAYARIGEWNGSTGVVTVTGAGSSWAINGGISLIVGNQGVGTLNIADGASVTANHASGYVLVGNINTGTLNITNGSTLTSGGTLATIGYGSGGNGVVTIDGAGSMWTVTNPVLTVARASNGTLDIRNGGEVVAQNGVQLAEFGTATGTLNLSGGGILDTLSLTAGVGTPQVNFDNGVLQARANNANFITGFTGTELNIAADGLEVDSGGFNVGTDAASGFTGTGGLTKTGAGTFTLQAVNTYTGETLIQAGTLALSGNGGIASSGRVIANSIFDVAGISGASTSIRSLAGSGSVEVGGKTLTLTAANDTFSGVISGTGGLTLEGGAQTLTGDSSAFAGATSVEAGTLAVNGSLCGAMNVQAGGLLQGTGTVCDTTNAGAIGPGNSFGTLLIDGNYTASGGTLEIEAQLDGTGSPADRLLITGNVTGTTQVNVTNVGGTGTGTGTGAVDGISIIQVGGASAADSFYLPGGYVAAGPYQYALNAFDPASSAAGELDARLAAEGVTIFWDYRLQTVLDEMGNPVPAPQVPAYQALPSGAFRYGGEVAGALHEAAECGVEKRIYMQAKGARTNFRGDRGPSYDQTSWFLQAGFTPVMRDFADGGTFCAGAALTYGGVHLGVHSSSAQVSMPVVGAAVTATYRSAGGWYVNAAAMANVFNPIITTSERGVVGQPAGAGIGASLQAGHSIAMHRGADWRFAFEPAARLTWQRAWFDTFTDVDNILTGLQGGNSLVGEIGGRIVWQGRTAPGRGTTLHAGAFLKQEFLQAESINAAGVAFQTDLGGTSIRFDAGFETRLSDRTNLNVNAIYEKGFGLGTGDTFGATARIRTEF